jgi:undecaprenyl phosphate N,N'-diacetylbacillosamine 1-phosphate transferase
MIYRRVLKRILDLVASALALVVLSPWIALTALLVRITSHGPALFVQERLGRRGTTFRAYKFRTMTHVERTPDLEITAGNPEVTAVGAFLRRFKIDELPQLLNVLRGDMSLVGPRPALVRDLARYDEVTRRRLDVRPGLTGLAQIHGGIHLTWPERWRYDVRYVDEMSFALDVRILFRTIAVLFLGEDKLLERP